MLSLSKHERTLRLHRVFQSLPFDRLRTGQGERIGKRNFDNVYLRSC
ncbi:MAG: hypothetical protein LBD67_07520 [Candidatus Accumulibacter sp.]|nr:hypothetical protein [Accumulibacter sp.]